MKRAALGLCLLLAACGGGSDRELSGQRLCGSKTILGSPAEPIPGKLKGCGLSDGVKVTSVAGVRLSSPSTVTCETARALESWVEEGATPAFKKSGGGLRELWVMASYSCRPRNGIPGNRISEHGRGKAIDIGGFRLQDGSEVTVLAGWNSRANKGAVRQAFKAACGPFGTVLGPKSDVFHQTHFHFDTASYRSGPYCR